MSTDESFVLQGCLSACSCRPCIGDVSCSHVVMYSRELLSSTLSIIASLAWTSYSSYARGSTAEAVKVVHTHCTPSDTAQTKHNTILQTKSAFPWRQHTHTRMSAAVAFQSPKYIQQAGALQRVGEFAKESFKDARKAGILTSARLRSRYMEAMCQSVANPVIAEFSGECSRSNLHSILGKMQGQQVDYIIGFGGGKLLDMAKLVGFPACFLQQKLPAARHTQLLHCVLPTIPATRHPSAVKASRQPPRAV